MTIYLSRPLSQVEYAEVEDFIQTLPDNEIRYCLERLHKQSPVPQLSPRTRERITHLENSVKSLKNENHRLRVDGYRISRANETLRKNETQLKTAIDNMSVFGLILRKLKLYGHNWNPMK